MENGNKGQEPGHLKESGCLAGYRALDLTDDKGFLCGAILGGFGMDVIKIERPGGEASRNIGPFYHDVAEPNKSLYFFAYNTNKRGITLNLETREGLAILEMLARKADFVIESFSPGYLDSIGLGYERLEQINPRLILTSITPFGQTGPHKDFASSDIVSDAMSGIMYITGDADRPPVRMSFPQANLFGGIHAAVGSLIAHYYREISGQGQHVDISIQESMVPVVSGRLDRWAMQHFIERRAGASAYRGRVRQREIWPCKDGYVNFRFMGGKFTAGIRPLAEWMDEEGKAGILKDLDWEAVDMANVTQEQMAAWEGAFSDFFKAHTVSELYEESAKRGIYLGPCYSIDQVTRDPQLAKRGFWKTVEHPELDASITYPGAPFRFSLTPWRVLRRAPLIGEHNDEVYEKELGFSHDYVGRLKEASII